MPIRGRPLLDYWLRSLRRVGVTSILVNGHHHAPIVRSFLDREIYAEYVHFVFEPNLLGTAATLRQNALLFADKTTMLVHADNLVTADLGGFIAWHSKNRPQGTALTMMTFDTPDPRSCGIVELDSRGVVCGFHEKVADPPKGAANGAVYLLEPEVTEWIASDSEVTDFSTQVIRRYLGKIAVWHNDEIHRDIGTPAALCEAQKDAVHIDPDDSFQKWEYFEQFARVVADVEKICLRIGRNGP
jgi:mannose-1-phosphate guanylyltransferase